MSQALVKTPTSALPALPVRASGYGALLINFVKDLQKSELFDEPVEEKIVNGNVVIDYLPVYQNNVRVGQAFQLDIRDDKVLLTHRGIYMDESATLPDNHTTEFQPDNYAGMAMLIVHYAKQHLEGPDAIFNPVRESKIAEAITRFVHTAGQSTSKALQKVVTTDVFALAASRGQTAAIAISADLRSEQDARQYYYDNFKPLWIFMTYALENGLRKNHTFLDGMDCKNTYQSFLAAARTYSRDNTLGAKQVADSWVIGYVAQFFPEYKSLERIAEGNFAPVFRNEIEHLAVAVIERFSLNNSTKTSDIARLTELAHETMTRVKFSEPQQGSKPSLWHRLVIGR